MPIKVNGLL